MCICACVCIYVHMCVQVYVDICVCYLGILICVYLCTYSVYIYAYIYIYMYVHMCGYSCIHPPQLLLLPVSFCSDFPNQLISPKVASSSSSSANSQTEKGSFQYFSVTVLRPPNPDHCDHDWTGLCHMPGVSQ